MSEEIEVVGHLLTRSPKFQDRLVKSEEGAAQAFLARGEGAIEPVMTVSQHNRIVEQYKQLLTGVSRAYEHATHLEELRSAMNVIDAALSAQGCGACDECHATALKAPARPAVLAELSGSISGLMAGMDATQKQPDFEALMESLHAWEVLTGEATKEDRRLRAELEAVKAELEQCKRDAERVRAALLDIAEESTDHSAVLCARAALSAQPDHVGEANKMVKPEPKCSACGDSGILGHSALCECQQAEVKP